jgi:hypothetical protein
MQMPPESGNVRSPLPDSDENVWPDLARFLPDSSGSSHIRSDPGHFGQISSRVRPDPVGT